MLGGAHLQLVPIPRGQRGAGDLELPDAAVREPGLERPEILDVTTGKYLGSKGWWDHDAEPSSPREVAPGILWQDDQLRVHGAVIPLPDKAVVCAAESGALFVASTANGRVELLVTVRYAARTISATTTK